MNHPEPAADFEHRAKPPSLPLGSLVWVVILAGLVFGLYHQVLFGLSKDWYSNPDYSHGFLVPVLAGYFAWERRGSILSLSPVSNMWGVGLLGLGLTLLVLGSLGAEFYVQRISFIVVLAGLILFLLGKEFLTLLAFPIAFLFLMIPLPAIVVNTITFPLQLFAAKIASLCLFQFGIPVLREGNIIFLAQTTLDVAEACSGLRSLQALITLGVIYAYFSQHVLWKKLVLVVISIPIAISANAFRVTGTGFLAQHFGAAMAEGFYHTFSGWLIFVVAFILLLGVGMGLSKIKTEPERAKV